MTDNGLRWPNIQDLVGELQSGKKSVVELTKQCLDAIKSSEKFNAVIEVNQKALERAKTVEAGDKKGKLYGVRFLAKDNFLTSHTHTTAARNLLKPF